MKTITKGLLCGSVLAAAVIISGCSSSGYSKGGNTSKGMEKTGSEVEAIVNQILYREWGFNPVAMPWPDVPVALKQGVIEGLDHTPMVCNITKKFEVCKYYTYINYAHGLLIWLFN